MNYGNAGSSPQPWLAVASFVNPHDIASAYPLSWWMPEDVRNITAELAAKNPNLNVAAGVQNADNDIETPRPIPVQGDLSNPIPGGFTRIELNPRGFPQNTFTNFETLHEDLSTKPDCQFDYSYKMGLALKSRRPPVQREYMAIPFQTRKNSDDWFSAFGQFYTYLHTLSDTQIHRVISTLRASGLDQNTIVVFLSDHGEYSGAHGGMIEKWHTAYDEILRVPMVVSSPLVNPNSDQITYIDQITSHIDVLPTLLGLANLDESDLAPNLGDHTYFPLPGVNLAPQTVAPGQPVLTADGQPRNSVLYITDDTITEYLKEQQPAQPGYDNFLSEVNTLIQSGIGLAEGAIRQPCHIRCVREG